MTATTLSPYLTPAAEPRAPGPPGTGHRRARPAHDRRPLARYRDREGRERDVVARPGAHASVLVVDRDAATLADCRLVAHLWPDEPELNARVVVDAYVADPDGR